jgi:tetratricopeptide (TPR) repeat protein
MKGEKIEMANLNEDDKKNSFKSAHLYFQGGQWDKAIAEYEKILKSDSEDMNIHNMLGDLYVKKNDPAKAYEAYIKVTADLNNRGQTDKVIMMYKKIARLDGRSLGPEDQQKHRLILLSLKAEEVLAENKIEEAMEVFSEILKSDPEDMASVLKLAELEEKLGRNPGAVERYSSLGETFLKNRLFKKAQEMFKKVLTIDPENISARSNLAQTYIKQGSENEAKKEYLNVAEQALAQKDLDGAYEYAKIAVELKSIEAHYLVGVVLFERGKWTEAKEEFELLLRFKLNHVAALVFLGKIYVAMNQSPKATETFQKALKIENDNLFALEAWAEYCVKKNNKTEAIQVLNLLIDRAGAESNGAGAVKWARTLISVDENLLASKSKLAEALQKNNDSQGAADVYYHLALTYGKQNKAEDAAKYIRKTLELNRTHAGALAATHEEVWIPEITTTSRTIPESQEKNKPIVSKMTSSEPPKAHLPSVSPQEALKAQLDVADHYVKQGLLDAAIEIYQQLIEGNPNNSDVKEKLNRVYAAYANTGTDLTGAFKTETILSDETLPTKGNDPLHTVSRSELMRPNLGSQSLASVQVPQGILGEVKKHTETSEKDLRVSEAKAREEADKKVKVELEKRALEEAEKKFHEEEEKKVHEATEHKIREDEEKKIREAMEKKIREDVERKVRAEIEKGDREETETKARQEAEKKALEEAESKIREQEEDKRFHEEMERKVREDVERRAREEADKKSLGEIQNKIREAVEKKTREHEEKKAREAAENHERLEMERKVREEVEVKVKEKMEKKAHEEAEKRIRESVEREVREAAEKNVREEIERRIREELEKKYREDDKKKVREEAKKKIHEVMNKKTEVLGAMIALTEADQFHGQGRYEEALKLYHKILESNPDDPYVLQKIGAVQAVLKANEAPLQASPPTLKVIESPIKITEPPASSNATVSPEPEKDSETKKKNNKIGYV